MYSYQIFHRPCEIACCATSSTGKVLVGTQDGETATWRFISAEKPPVRRLEKQINKVMGASILYLGYTEDILPVMVWLSADKKIIVRYLEKGEDFSEFIIAPIWPIASCFKIASINCSVDFMIILVVVPLTRRRKFYFYDFLSKRMTAKPDLTNGLVFNNSGTKIACIRGDDIIVLGTFRDTVDGFLDEIVSHQISRKDYPKTSKYVVEKMFISNNNQCLVLVEQDQSVLALYRISHEQIHFVCSFNLNEQTKLKPGVILNHCAIYEAAQNNTVISVVFSDGSLLLWSVKQLRTGALMQSHYHGNAIKASLARSAFISSADEAFNDYLMVIGKTNWVSYIKWTDYLTLPADVAPIFQQPVLKRRNASSGRR